jgi:hypothetical protein
MKKIVLDSSELINIADVSNYAKVGIQWANGKKTIIIQTRDGFVGLDGSLDILNSWEDDSMTGYIERALKQGNNEGTQAFYFNKSSELFKWMSE